MSKDREPMLRVAAAGALGRLGDDEGYSLAVKAIEKPRDLYKEFYANDSTITDQTIMRLQTLGAVALGLIKQPSGVDVLLPLLKGSNGEVRMSAARSVLEMVAQYRPADYPFEAEEGSSKAQVFKSPYVTTTSPAQGSMEPKPLVPPSLTTEPVQPPAVPTTQAVPKTPQQQTEEELKGYMPATQPQAPPAAATLPASQPTVSPVEPTPAPQPKVTPAEPAAVPAAPAAPVAPVAPAAPAAPASSQPAAPPPALPDQPIALPSVTPPPATQPVTPRDPILQVSPAKD